MLYLGDCLEILPSIPDKSVDLVLTDLPYGLTANWKNTIDMNLLWPELRRVVKPKAAIVLFSNQPFTTYLISSNSKEYRYLWYWEKTKAVGHLTTKHSPMRNIEEILVFGVQSTRYYPQMVKRDKPRKITVSYSATILYSGQTLNKKGEKYSYISEEKYPTNILKFKQERYKGHPTVKPVALLEYLIKTYSLEGETVLDATMGSGSTGVACKNTNREFIGIEIDKNYFELAKERVND